jgi:hypothetical protein
MGGNSVTNNNYGEQNAQFGANSNMAVGANSSITVNNSQSAADTAAALREMISLVLELRAQVSPADRADIDESVSVIRQGERAGPGAMRRAVRNVVGIAKMAGTVGGPALDAALKVKELLGL